MSLIQSPTTISTDYTGLLTMKNFEDILFSPQTRLFDCFPGGNDTFFVVNPSLSRDEYARINKLVLEHYPKFEQGAVLEPSSQGAVLRMQMTGGEFCGNATRSVAALIAETYMNGSDDLPVANYSLITQDNNVLTFPVEVSGTDNLVTAKATRDENGWDVEIELPRLPERKVSATTILEFSGTRVPCTVVELEGISHILISDSQMPFTNNQDRFNSMVADVITQLSWSDRAAFGLIWVKQVDNQLAIEPVVFVKSIQTCIYESACGSGSIAVALASTPEGTQQVTSVRQPSGAVLQAGIDETNTIQGIGATLRGPVEIRGDLNQAPRLFAANE